MAPKRIRLIHSETRSVCWQEVDAVKWDKVWTVSHVWDKRGEITIPLEGVSWKSRSFSTPNRFNIAFDKVRQIVQSREGEYVWMDAACIDQGREEEQKEQVPFMETIYSKSAGCVAFGTLSADDRFVPIVSSYDGGRKAWVCDWFERVWVLQELQLPKVLLFISGDHVLTGDDLYLWTLMMSPYLTPSYPSPPLHPEDPSLSIHDVLNALSPSSRNNTYSPMQTSSHNYTTQRTLMQASKRGCSTYHIQDKIYGVMGVLSRPFPELKVDYDISLKQVVLNLSLLMPPKDVLDALTFNTLPPRDNVHDALHWSGMVMLDGPMEHPTYHKDIYYPTYARVTLADDTSLPRTVVRDAPLWTVVVTKPGDNHAASPAADIPTQAWPSIAASSRYARLPDDFSKVERPADYADVVGRAQRSLRANKELLQPMLEMAVGGIGKAFSALFHEPSSKTSESSKLPSNRLGDETLFYQQVTVLVCRSKKDELFYYGIVVRPNGDGTWHKVCTASFSERSCHVVAKRVENVVVIGK